MGNLVTECDVITPRMTNWKLFLRLSPVFVAWAVFHIQTGVCIQFIMSCLINLHCSYAKYITTGIMACFKIGVLIFSMFVNIPTIRWFCLN